MQTSLEQLRLLLGGTGGAPFNPIISGGVAPYNSSIDWEKTIGREDSPTYVFFEEDLNVHLWIDVPNSFPWRKCLQKYVNRIITYGCAAQVP